MKKEWPEAVIVESGPCKEVIIKEDDIDLSAQVPKVWFTEGQSWITGLISVTLDPETGERNVGWYRYGFYDKHPETGELYDEKSYVHYRFIYRRFFFFFLFFSQASCSRIRSSRLASPSGRLMARA